MALTHEDREAMCCGRFVSRSAVLLSILSSPARHSGGAAGRGQPQHHISRRLVSGRERQGSQAGTDCADGHCGSCGRAEHCDAAAAAPALEPQQPPGMPHCHRHSAGVLSAPAALVQMSHSWQTSPQEVASVSRDVVSLRHTFRQRQYVTSLKGVLSPVRHWG